jgi:pimeloyl-ACP methyl ester carboxylesterase
MTAMTEHQVVARGGRTLHFLERGGSGDVRTTADGMGIQPWGFDLDSIRTLLLLVHGRQDRFVRFADGEWLARHIPSVQAELTDDDGHLTLTRRHLDYVPAWLLRRLD